MRSWLATWKHIVAVQSPTPWTQPSHAAGLSFFNRKMGTESAGLAGTGRVLWSRSGVGTGVRVVVWGPGMGVAAGGLGCTPPAWRGLAVGEGNTVGGGGPWTQRPLPGRSQTSPFMERNSGQVGRADAKSGVGAGEGGLGAGPVRAGLSPGLAYLPERRAALGRGRRREPRPT